MASIFDMVDTWNEGSTTFTAIKMNVTDTASAAASLLMDLQVGGTSKFSVSKAGDVVGVRGFFFTTPQTVLAGDSFGFGTSKANGLYGVNSSGQLGLLVGTKFYLGNKNNSFEVHTSVSLGWSTTPGSGHPGATESGDLYLRRDAANILAQRNGVNPQAFRLYNTHTDAANYELGSVGWSGNVFSIGTASAGTGNASRTLAFDAGTSAQMQFRFGGGVYLKVANVALFPSTAATNFDLGLAGIGFRNLYLKGSSVVMTGLPTADPAVVGTLWNDGGTVKISAG